MFTFYDLGRFAEDLVTPFDPGDIEYLSMDELFDLGNGSNIVRKLLHDAINEHFTALGLVVDNKRRRVHYPKEEEPNRKITYKGRVKRATRAVVKARTKRDSDEIIYYEHKALSFSIMAFALNWALVLSPGYVFTRDGIWKHISRERTNILSTKRAARDFNPSVQHDVAFWLACISEESDGVFSLKCKEDNDYSGYSPTIVLANKAPTISFNSSAFEWHRSVEQELEDILSEAEEELEELASRPEYSNEETSGLEDQDDA